MAALQLSPEVRPQWFCIRGKAYRLGEIWKEVQGAEAAGLTKFRGDGNERGDRGACKLEANDRYLKGEREAKYRIPSTLPMRMQRLELLGKLLELMAPAESKEQDATHSGR